MTYLPRVAVLSLRHRVNNSFIPRTLGVVATPPPQQIGYFTLNRMRYLIRMPFGCLPLEVYFAGLTGERTKAKLKICWKTTISVMRRPSDPLEGAGEERLRKIEVYDSPQELF